MSQRVIAYIDGFNLYFGLKRAKLRRFYWLNLQLLAKTLLTKDQELILTKYFTSRISYPADKQKRQSVFIEALETLDDMKIFYGKYQANPRWCRKCGFKDMVPNEKMTDVNIAVEILSDAYQDNFDSALLISGDSDLTAPVLAVKNLFPHKRVVIAFPPKTVSVELSKHANAFLSIGRANIAKSVFPPEVPKANGFLLKSPAEWR